MQIKKHVPIGNCVWSGDDSILYCLGLGSCMAVCLYDTEHRRGCLAHILLPQGDSAERPFFYADIAIKKMNDQVNDYSLDKKKIWVKIIGGANLFGQLCLKSIGTNNINAIRYWLNYYDFKIEGEDTGGNEGRNVFFDLSDGRISIYTLKRGAVVL